jgi:hypothetical protein
VKFDDGRGESFRCRAVTGSLSSSESGVDSNMIGDAACCFDSDSWDVSIEVTSYRKLHEYDKVI